MDTDAAATAAYDDGRDASRGSSPLRARSPRAPAYGEGAEGASGKKYHDFRMEPAPSWNGENPETEYRLYSRSLKLWLIEAEARLPKELIGKRIMDVIPFGSRLMAQLAHLSIDDITAQDGYREILKIIDKNHEYLRDMKLEQAFEGAIFRGRRRPDQTISGFLDSKKAAFNELKRQGLDLLENKAGQHLLGHLILKQGQFTDDQRQRIRVLTDGSIDYVKIESAIRKIFSDSLEHPGKGSRSTYWGEGYPEDYNNDDDDPENSWYDPETGATYYFDHEEEDIFEDLLEMNDQGETYMVLEEALPQVLEEAEAVEFAGSYLSFVYYEANERLKGKGKGKGKSKGKGRGAPYGKGYGKTSGKGSKGPPGVFGVYGSYMELVHGASTSTS